MKRKILLLLVLVIGFIYSSAGMPALGYDEEISEENINKANVYFNNKTKKFKIIIKRFSC